MTKRAYFDTLIFDEQEYKCHYQRNQIEYIRIRLRCVKLFRPKSYTKNII